VVANTYCLPSGANLSTNIPPLPPPPRRSHNPFLSIPPSFPLLHIYLRVTVNWLILPRVSCQVTSLVLFATARYLFQECFLTELPSVSNNTVQYTCTCLHFVSACVSHYGTCVLYCLQECTLSGSQSIVYKRRTNQEACLEFPTEFYQGTCLMLLKEFFVVGTCPEVPRVCPANSLSSVTNRYPEHGQNVSG
jgi:hypothetical protein